MEQQESPRVIQDTGYLLKLLPNKLPYLLISLQKVTCMVLQIVSTPDSVKERFEIDTMSPYISHTS